MIHILGNNISGFEFNMWNMHRFEASRCHLIINSRGLAAGSFSPVVRERPHSCQKGEDL